MKSNCTSFSVPATSHGMHGWVSGEKKEIEG